LAVGMQLKTSNPEGFEELMQFAEENQLNILNGEGAAMPIPE